MASEVADNVGFGRSDVKSYVLSTGQTSTERIDLDRPYAFIVLFCEDASNIASTTTLSLKVSPEQGIPLLDVYEQNDLSTLWSTGNLPTSGTFYVMCTHAFGVRFVQPVLDTATDGEVTIKVLGYDPTVVNQKDM